MSTRLQRRAARKRRQERQRIRRVASFLVTGYSEHPVLKGLSLRAIEEQLAVKRMLEDSPFERRGVPRNPFVDHHNHSRNAWRALEVMRAVELRGKTTRNARAMLPSAADFDAFYVPARFPVRSTRGPLWRTYTHAVDGWRISGRTGIRPARARRILAMMLAEYRKHGHSMRREGDPVIIGQVFGRYTSDVVCKFMDIDLTAPLGEVIT